MQWKDGDVMDSMKQAPDSSQIEKSGSEVGGARSHPGAWRLLAWSTLLAIAGLVVTTFLVHILSPSHSNWVGEILPAVAAIAAAATGGYFAMRKQEALLGLQADAERRVAFENRLLQTVADN